MLSEKNSVDNFIPNSLSLERTQFESDVRETSIVQTVRRDRRTVVYIALQIYTPSVIKFHYSLVRNDRLDEIVRERHTVGGHSPSDTCKQTG